MVKCQASDLTINTNTETSLLEYILKLSLIIFHKILSDAMTRRLLKMEVLHLLS